MQQPLRGVRQCGWSSALETAAAWAQAALPGTWRQDLPVAGLSKGHGLKKPSFCTSFINQLDTNSLAFLLFFKIHNFFNDLEGNIPYRSPCCLFVTKQVSKNSRIALNIL